MNEISKHNGDCLSLIQIWSCFRPTFISEEITIQIAHRMFNLDKNLINEQSWYIVLDDRSYPITSEVVDTRND